MEKIEFSISDVDLTATSLSRYLKNDSKDKPNKCKQCPKEFKYTTALSRHIKTHSKRVRVTQ